jgi:hypothetical protein
MAIDAGIRDPATAEAALQAFEVARDRSLPLYDLGWAMASYDWDTSTMLELQARFSVELIREAQETADMPSWPGSLHAPPLRDA